MSKSLYLDLPLNLIQSVRLAHAIMETNYEVVILPKDEEKFLILQNKFEVKYKISNQLPAKLNEINILHSQPQTSVGSLERPLIFPHGIFRYCKSLWSEQRDIRFAFAGLVTDNRKQFFKKIITLNYPQNHLNFDRWIRPSLLSKLQSKIANKLGIDQEKKTTKRKYKDIVFWSSQRGRQFPIKSWDDEYFKLLANSEFVFCPNGDYIWTYRFFEAAMCGAIPIIEDYCAVYDGFRFRTIEESIHTMNWSQEDADHNYNLCQSLLTVPIDILQQEIANLLSRN